MSIHVISVLVLLGVFLLGTVRPLNLGALSLVATFAVGTTLAGEGVDEVLAGFPADIFVLLFGVTYLFAIASVNGTIDWMVHSLTRLVRGNRAAIPWVIFFVSAVPSTCGALGPAGVALLAPVALRLAHEHRIDLRMAALMVIHGSAAGNFSPINPLGAIVNGTVDRSDLPTSPLALFAANFAYNVGLAVVIYLVYGGVTLYRERRAAAVSSSAVLADQVSAGAAAARTGPPSPARTAEPPSDGSPPASEEPEHALNRIISTTLAGIATVALGALVFGLDVGMLAVAVALLLHLIFPKAADGALDRVGWKTVLLICGILTYVGMLERIGTVDAVGNAVSTVGTPLLAAFLILVIAAVVSAFASSTGILGAMIPLSIPFLATGNLPVIGVVIALAIAATVVDSTPFSTVGALAVASAPEEKRDFVFSGLLRWGFAMVATAPVLTWLLFVLPGTL